MDRFWMGRSWGREFFTRSSELESFTKTTGTLTESTLLKRVEERRDGQWVDCPYQDIGTRDPWGLGDTRPVRKIHQRLSPLS